MIDNNVALVYVVNHMDFGGCQKIVFDLIVGVNKGFNRVYLISKKGYYSNLLASNDSVRFYADENLFLKKYMLIKKLQKKHAKIVLHTHNRIDMFLKFSLAKHNTHIHTFHSAYTNKNYIYKFVKPEVAISISHTVKSYLNRYGITSQMIYNGIDFDKTMYHQNDFDKTKIKLVYIGRVTKEKGFDKFLENFLYFKPKEINSKLELYVIGDSIHIEKYKNIVRNSNSENRVFFRGFQKNPWANANQYDFLVVPSYFEGFCLVAAEAAAIGMPVVGNNIEALREVLSFSSEESFFNINDKNSVFKVLFFIISNYQKQKRKSLNNTTLIREKFSKEDMINKYIRLYESKK